MVPSRTRTRAQMSPDGDRGIAALRKEVQRGVENPLARVRHGDNSSNRTIVRFRIQNDRALCKQKKWPRKSGAVLRQREAERIRRAISFAQVCAEVAPAAMPVLCRRRAPAARSEAPVPLASRKKRPRFCGAVLRQREAERIRRAISFARVCAEAAPAAMPGSCHRRRARPPPGPARLCPLQAEKTAPLLRGRQLVEKLLWQLSQSSFMRASKTEKKEKYRNSSCIFS